MKAPMTSLLVASALATVLASANLRANTAAENASVTIPPSVQSNCLICHSIGAKNEPTQAIAPPLFAVKNHLREFGDRDAFIAHVSAWVKAPSADNARMRGAVKKFGLMPAFPLADDVLEEIAGWIYDTPMNKPNWYAKHYRKEHGKKATN